MKTIILILLMLFGVFTSKIQAQQSVNVSGGNGTGAGGTVSYSIGQIDYTSRTGFFSSISQGVQQTYDISTLGTEDFPNINLTMAVYPNPTTSFINLKIDDYNTDNLTYILFDMQGKQIENQKIIQGLTQITMVSLAKSIYFLNVLDNNKIIKTFKIIKNN